MIRAMCKSPALAPRVFGLAAAALTLGACLITPEDAAAPHPALPPGTPPDPMLPPQPDDGGGPHGHSEAPPQPIGNGQPNPNADGPAGPVDADDGTLTLSGDLAGRVIYSAYTDGQLILDALPLVLEDGVAPPEPHVVPQPGAFAFLVLPEQTLVLRATVDLGRDGPTDDDLTVLFDRFALDLADPATPRDIRVDLDLGVVTDAEGRSLIGPQVTLPVRTDPSGLAHQGLDETEGPS
jgi:hypothetical protein